MHLIRKKELLCKAVEVLLDEHQALLRVAGEAALLVAHCDLSQDRNSWLRSMSTLSHSINALPDQLLEDIFFLTLSEKDKPEIQPIKLDKDTQAIELETAKNLSIM